MNSNRPTARRWISGAVMALGASMAMIGAFGMGPVSGATDAPEKPLVDSSVPGSPGDTAPEDTQPTPPAPDTPSAPEDTPSPEAPENQAPEPKPTETTVPTGAETTAKARVSCIDEAIIVDVANVGTADGTYTVSFTPDGGAAEVKVVTVPTGAQRSVSLAIAAGASGVLDIRSAGEVVMDQRRIASKCPVARVTGEAVADCAAQKLRITLRNDGDADGTYRVTYTPDAGDAVSRDVTVPAGATTVESIEVSLPIRGVVDVRSASQVVLDHQRIDEPCSKPSTTGTARFACETNQLIVNLRNDGDRAGTYTLSYTPDGSAAVTSTVEVPARSEAVFALAVTPPRSGVVDVRSGSEIVIGGRRVEVNCATTTTTTAPGTTIAPTTVAPTTTPVSVAPATTVQPAVTAEALAATGSSSSLPLVAIGLALFVLGLMLVDLRPAPARSARR